MTFLAPPIVHLEQIEIDPGYFDIACRRIEAAQKQGDMFVPPPAVTKPVQDTMF